MNTPTLQEAAVAAGDRIALTHNGPPCVRGAVVERVHQHNALAVCDCGRRFFVALDGHYPITVRVNA